MMPNKTETAIEELAEKIEDSNLDKLSPNNFPNINVSLAATRAGIADFSKTG